MLKKIRFVFNENTVQFCELKKSYLYLMKIHISFVCLKQSDMYLMKIQISFYVLKKARSEKFRSERNHKKNHLRTCLKKKN